MNNLSSEILFLIDFMNLFGYYIIPVSGGVSAVANLICLLTFRQKNFDQKDKFKYLIIKCLYGFFGSLILTYFLNNLCFLQCVIYDSLANQIYGHYFIYYGTSALFLGEGKSTCFIILNLLY